MSGIPGVNVVAPVVPTSTTDVHPSHEAQYGKGGWRTVATLAERDAIPAPRREQGMVVVVAADGKRWELEADLTTWTELTMGGDVTSVAGRTGDVTLTTSDVGGLSAALAGKSNVGHGHSISDVTGLQSALDGKASATDARLTDAREWTASTVSQAEAEAGTATTRRAWTAERVRQAIAAGPKATVTVGRANADFIATGTSGSPTDHTTIQAAIDAVQTAGGGVVYIREGVYYLGATINITTANVAILGAGRSTELRAVGDYGNVFLCALPTVPTQWPGLSGLRFEHLRFESTVNRTSGAAIRANYTHQATFRDLYIADTTYGVSFGHVTPVPPAFFDGIYLDGQDQCLVSRVVAQCSRYSVHVNGSGYANADFSYDGLVEACDFYGVPSPPTPEDYPDPENWTPAPPTGVGVHLGANCGGVVIDYVSCNQLEYGIYADAFGTTQGGGILTIRGGYTENAADHGIFVKGYQTLVVETLWGDLRVVDCPAATVLGVPRGSVHADNSNVVVFGSPYATATSNGGTVKVINPTILDATYSAVGHGHGNITSNGRIGTTSGQIVVTGAGGTLTTSATISAGSVSGLAPVATAGTFASLTSRPTTLSGYGITDAASSTHGHGNLSASGTVGSTPGMLIGTTTGGALQAWTIGSGLSLTGSTLSASGGGGGLPAATYAETEARVSSTTTITPQRSLDAWFASAVIDSSGGSNFVTGSTNNAYGLFYTVGAAGGGGSFCSQIANQFHAPVSATKFNGSAGNYLGRTFNWSKRAILRFRLCIDAALTANTTFRVGFGKTTGGLPSIGPLAQRGVYIEIRGAGGVLWLSTHNGTSRTDTSSGVTLVPFACYEVIVESDGAGTARLFLDGTQVASSSGAPTTQLNDFQNTMFTIEGTTTDSTANRLWVERFWHFARPL